MHHDRKRGWLLATLALALLTAACAPYSEMGTRTYFGFTLLASNEAPPPPRVVIVDRPDAYVYDAPTRVYVVRDPGADCDVFRYGSSYYLYSGGFWYRSLRNDGGFLAVDVRSVPRPVLQVPENRWRHHPHGGPPGQRDRDRRG